VAEGEPPAGELGAPPAAGLEAVPPPTGEDAAWLGVPLEHAAAARAQDSRTPVALSARRERRARRRTLTARAGMGRILMGTPHVLAASWWRRRPGG
jgi:hypothetical protein